jgi:hypothetical protein
MEIPSFGEAGAGGIYSVLRLSAGFINAALMD